MSKTSYRISFRSPVGARPAIAGLLVLQFCCAAPVQAGPFVIDAPGVQADQAAFSGDGNYLAVRTGQTDKYFLEVWGLKEGRKLRSWGPFRKLSAIIIAPGEPVVAAAIQETEAAAKPYQPMLKSWRLDSGAAVVEEDIYKLLHSKDKGKGSSDLERVRPFPDPGGFALSVSHPDTNRCVVFQMLSGKKRKAETCAAYAAVSPDGRFTAEQSATMGTGMNIVVSDVATKKPVHTLNAESEAAHFAFSPDSRYLTVCDNGVSIWDLEKGSLVRRLKMESCGALLVSPEGLYAAGTGGKLLRVWRVPNAKVIKEVKSNGWTYPLAFSPDGRLGAFEVDGRLQVWDMAVLAEAAKDDSDRRLDELDASLKSGKTGAGALIEKGNLHLGRGETKEALRAFSLAIEAKPGAAAYAGRGKTRLSADDAAEALADFTEAVRLQPGSAELYFGRGLAHLALQRKDEAIRDLDQALKLDPGLAQARLHRGVAYYLKGRFEEAEAELTAVLKTEPRSTAALLNRGLVRQSLGRKDAVADFSAAIAADPRCAAAYQSRGVARMNAGDDADAIADLSRAMDLDRRDSDSPVFLGRIYHRLGDTTDKAMHAFQAALDRSNNKNAEAHFGLGVMTFGSGRPPIHLEFALKLDPGNTLYAEWYKRDQAIFEKRVQADVDAQFAARSEYQNPAAALSAGLIGIARGIANGVNTGGSGSGGGTSYRSSSYSAPEAAGPAPSMGSGGQSTTAKYNEQVRQNVERKLWNMNNPYRISR